MLACPEGKDERGTGPGRAPAPTPIMQAVIVNGVFVGLIYGLLGVGLVVVYRGSRVVNFAYGETGMLAAFVYADIRFGHSALSSGDRGLTIALPAGTSDQYVQLSFTANSVQNAAQASEVQIYG